MIQKQIVNPARMRRMPEGFGWIDHRLVRADYISKFSCESLALYLFLLTVADSDGVSWYSDRSICEKLSMDVSAVLSARKELISGDLVAYRKPHYQVLELPEPEAQRYNFRKAVKEASRELEVEGVLNMYSPFYRPDENSCKVVSVSGILDAMGGCTDD